MAKKFYAYFIDGNKTGIVENWEECKNIVHGFKARYKSFSSLKEAEDWLTEGAIYSPKKKKTFSVDDTQFENAVFFDAGTGRGRGTEVRITNKYKESLAYLIDTPKFKNFLEKKSWFINEFDNVELGPNKTNNFGELFGLYLALECASILNSKNIFGDSKLVLDYWSKNIFQANNLDNDTIALIKKVSENRKKFEALNGKVKHISGDINPADLGFHK